MRTTTDRAYDKPHSYFPDVFWYHDHVLVKYFVPFDLVWSLLQLLTAIVAYPGGARGREVIPVFPVGDLEQFARYTEDAHGCRIRRRNCHATELDNVFILILDVTNHHTLDAVHQFDAPLRPPQ